MWNWLKTIINVDTFCYGCEAYAKYLASLGFTPDIPVTGESRPTSQSALEPANLPLDTPDFYVLKAAGNLSHAVVRGLSINTVNRFN